MIGTKVKTITIYRHYTRAQMNQRRVVGITIIAILIGSILGIATPEKTQIRQPSPRECLEMPVKRFNCRFTSNNQQVDEVKK